MIPQSVCPRGSLDLIKKKQKAGWVFSKTIWFWIKDVLVRMIWLARDKQPTWEERGNALAHKPIKRWPGAGWSQGLGCYWLSPFIPRPAFPPGRRPVCHQLWVHILYSLGKREKKFSPPCSSWNNPRKDSERPDLSHMPTMDNCHGQGCEVARDRGTLVSIF